MDIMALAESACYVNNHVKHAQSHQQTAHLALKVTLTSITTALYNAQQDISATPQPVNAIYVPQNARVVLVVTVIVLVAQLGINCSCRQCPVLHNVQCTRSQKARSVLRVNTRVWSVHQRHNVSVVLRAVWLGVSVYRHVIQVILPTR